MPAGCKIDRSTRRRLTAGEKIPSESPCQSSTVIKRAPALRAVHNTSCHITTKSRRDIRDGRCPEGLRFRYGAQRGGGEYSNEETASSQYDQLPTPGGPNEVCEQSFARKFPWCQPAGVKHFSILFDMLGNGSWGVLTAV